jgi:hypothetical protein
MELSTEMRCFMQSKQQQHRLELSILAVADVITLFFFFFSLCFLVFVDPTNTVFVAWSAGSCVGIFARYYAIGGCSHGK